MVEYFLGKRELISFSDFESVYGSAETPLVLLGRDATWTPNNSQNWQEVKGAGTDSIDIDVQEPGLKGVAGTLAFVPQNWKFLKFVLCSSGASVTDTDNSTYYTHTFTNDKTVGSFTFERAIQHTTDRVRTYVGCQVNRFGLSFDAAGGGFVSCTADLMNRDVSNGTSTTSLSPLTTEGFKARQASVTINGSAEVKVLNGSLNIENSLSPGRYANYDNDNRLKSESGVTTRRVNGSFTIDLTDDTYFDIWETATKISGACSLKLTRGTNDDITFTLNDVYVPDAPDPTNLEGINSVTLNFKAKSVTAVAKDSLSNYGTFS